MTWPFVPKLRSEPPAGTTRFGALVRQFRVSQGMSLDDASLLWSQPKALLSRMEGGRLPSLRRFLVMCEMCGIEPKPGVLDPFVSGEDLARIHEGEVTMALRVTEDRVNLEFEKTIPLLGKAFRTKASRAEKPPYYELAAGEDGYEIDSIRNDGAGERVVGPITLRDMHFLLEGIRLADNLTGEGEDDESA